MFWQVIIGEGQVVPADAKVICDYGDSNGWEELNAMQERGDLEEEPQVRKKTRETKRKLKLNLGVKVTASARKEMKKARKAKTSKSRPKKRGYPILNCDHFAITGESLAVDRYMGEVIYYTTGCKRGKAYAVVETTAKYSFVGRTASMVQGAQGAGHFEIVMDTIGAVLLVLVMAWILAAWIGGFFRGLPIASPGQQTLFHYTLALMIVGVPVGLPVVTTTTMAVEAAYLAKKKAIVQKLTAIESLAVCATFP